MEVLAGDGVAGVLDEELQDLVRLGTKAELGAQFKELAGLRAQFVRAETVGWL